MEPNDQGKADKRWRAEEARRQLEDPPDEADDRDTPDP